MRQLAFLAPGLALLAAAAPLRAQQAPGEASGRATATIVKPIELTSLAELDFGAITAGPQDSGAVTVPAAGGGASYAGATRPGCAGGADCQPHPAQFAVRGEAGRHYRILLPAGGVAARGLRTGASLSVAALTSASGRGTVPGPMGELDGQGEDLVAVGGTLEVPPGTRPDIFRADLPVTVVYD